MDKSQARARVLHKDLKAKSAQKRAQAILDLHNLFPDDANEFRRQCMRDAPDFVRNGFVQQLFDRHVTPERSSRYSLPEEFIRLLRWRLLPEDYQEGISWIESCASVNPTLEQLREQLKKFENVRRHLPRASRDNRINNIGAVIKRLHRATDRYLQVNWLATISRTLLLEKMLNNIGWVLRPLRIAFPDEEREWEWLEVRARQLPRALWVLRDLLAEFTPSDLSLRRNMDKALENILEVTNDRAEVGFYLDHFELEVPQEAREIIVAGLNPKPRSRFDPRRYKWHEPCQLRSRDLAHFADALQTLSPLGRSLITVISLHRVLSVSPQSYGLAPVLQSEEGGPIDWSLACWMDFTGTPEVTPSKWPFRH